MAIIPAHNEENVIEALIESLNKQDYPKDYYDIYVIADNCTDRTAEIARKCGAIVMERFDEEHKTKGYALQWFLSQKIEEDAPYDAFCIFDADNIVDKNFIKNMNKKCKYYLRIYEPREPYARPRMNNSQMFRQSCPSSSLKR